MTREEAIANLNMISVAFVEPVTEEQRKLIDDTFEMAIQALEQEPILDKIRAEIEELDRYYDNDYFSTNNCPMYKCNEVLLIIDKYRSEGSGEE